MLAATVLTTFPNTAIIDPTAQDRRDATSTTLRRAIALIEQHPARGYQRRRHCSRGQRQHPRGPVRLPPPARHQPMAYLRVVRLDRAHHDLLATDPSHGDTVTAIAARWGFYSNSRFAAQ